MMMLIPKARTYPSNSFGRRDKYMIKLQYSMSMKTLLNLCQESVGRNTYCGDVSDVRRNAIDDR